MNADEFPILPKMESGETTEFNFENFKSALNEVVFAVSTNETQPEISGVLMGFSGNELKLVATDRYRLVEKLISLQKEVGTKRIIIPQKTISEVVRINASAKDMVVVSWTDSQVSFVCGGVEILSRLIDSQYPEYDHIIPKNFLTTVIIGRDDLISGLKTTSVFTMGSSTVKLIYGDGQAKLSAISQDLGQSECVLECEVNGASGEVMFNHKYIQDMLSVLKTESLSIKIINEDSPVIFEPVGEVGYMYLVMPIKI